MSSRMDYEGSLESNRKRQFAQRVTIAEEGVNQGTAVGYDRTQKKRTKKGLLLTCKGGFKPLVVVLLLLVLGCIFNFESWTVLRNSAGTKSAKGILVDEQMKPTVTNDEDNNKNNAEMEGSHDIVNDNSEIAISKTLDIDIDNNFAAETEGSNDIANDNEDNNVMEMNTTSNEPRNNNITKDIAIFFNTYINPDDQEHGSGIINEMIDRINSQPKLAHADIYYSRFGHLDVPWPQERCQGGNEAGRVCHEITSAIEGDELQTLQALYEYCGVPDNEQNRIIYIHSKGSFHFSENNELFRKVLLAGVLSDECIDMPKDSCSACSSQFTTMPIFQYAGNMFVSDCTYIRKLIPPNDFTEAKEKIVQTIRSHTTPSRFMGGDMVHTTNVPYPDGNGTLSYQFPGTLFRFAFLDAAWLGTDRYAMEHYILSHPDARPCDVFSTRQPLVERTHFGVVDVMSALLQNIQEGIVKPMLNIVPDYVHEGGENATYIINTGDCPVLVDLPWYCEEGRMYQYLALYPESGRPSSDSWLYDFWGNLRNGSPERPCI